MFILTMLSILALVAFIPAILCMFGLKFFADAESEAAKRCP
jgi:hypothetical protein